MRTNSERTTTSEAVLGVLSLAPMSGYQIRRQIENSIGNFWQESFGQIYPTLKRLRADGLVELVMGGGRGRAESKVYALTAAGRERLTAWIATPSTPQVWRNEMLLKIFFGGLVPVEAVREQIEAFRLRHAGELRKFAGIEAEMLAVRGKDPRLPFWRMTLMYGQAESRAMVAWAEEALRTCAELAAERNGGSERFAGGVELETVTGVAG